MPDPLLELLALETLCLCEAAPVIAAPAAIADPVEDLLAHATTSGSALLIRICRPAVKRRLASRHHHGHFFTDAEFKELVHELTAVVATSHLLGRSLLADQAERVRKRKGRVQESRLLEGLTPLAPLDAIDFFRNLIPTLGTDPLRLLPDYRRTAFTLAVATEKTLLQSVQDAIADLLGSGKAADGPAAISAILDAAEVSPRNSGYAEMVWRTNCLDSYHQGWQDQMAEERETFPVWRYSNPHDSRSRPSHAARNGLYYPASVPFVVVRGTGIEDAARCRCVPIAIDKWAWARLQSQGVRLAA